MATWLHFYLWNISNKMLLLKKRKRLILLQILHFFRHSRCYTFNQSLGGTWFRQIWELNELNITFAWVSAICRTKGNKHEIRFFFLHIWISFAYPWVNCWNRQWLCSVLWLKVQIALLSFCLVSRKHSVGAI